MQSSSSPVRLTPLDMSLNVDGFVVTETVRQAGMLLRSHYHDFTNVSLAVEGSFIETIGTHPREINPASLVIRAAGERHANRYHHFSRCIIVEITPAKAALVSDNLPRFDCAAHFKNEQFGGLARSFHRELHSGDASRMFALESLVFDLLAHATRQSSRLEPRAVGQVRDILQSNRSERVRLTDIAKSVGLHPTTLARQFRRHHGCSVGEYLRRIRL